MRPLERVPLNEEDLAELETQDWMMEIAFKTHRAFINSMYKDFGFLDKPYPVDVLNVRPLLSGGSFQLPPPEGHIGMKIDISDMSYKPLWHRLLYANLTSIHESAHYLHRRVNLAIYSDLLKDRDVRLNSFLEFMADYAGLIFAERYHLLSEYVRHVILNDLPYDSQFAAHRLFCTTRPSIAHLARLNPDEARAFHDRNIDLDVIIIGDSASENALAVPFEKDYNSKLYLREVVA